MNTDGFSVTKELETSTETKTNADSSVTVTDHMKETVKTENPDGTAVETITESENSETTGSKTNADGSVTETVSTTSKEKVTETSTDENGKQTTTETRTELVRDTDVTTCQNADGTETEKTETKETVKVTEKVTDAEGNITETVTETITETVVHMTINEDGTATGTSYTEITVKDEQGAVISTRVVEGKVTARTDEKGTKTIVTEDTITTTDCVSDNVTTEKTFTTENKTPDGSTSTIVKDDAGNVLSQETTVSQEEFENAMAEHRPIQAPLTVDPNSLDERGELPPIRVNLPPSLYDKDGDGKVAPGERPKIEIKVSIDGSGVIVAEVGPNGTLRIRKDCYEGSVIVPVNGSGELVVIDNTKTFADVPEGSWYYEYVTFVTAREILDGAEEGRFAPDEPLSRALLMQTLYSFHPGMKAGDGTVFSDVKADDWFCDAVGWAYENGIAEGREGAFSPLEGVTCGDMITYLCRWAGSCGYDVSAAAGAADPAAGAMRWAEALGLFSGIEDGTLTADDSVARAQAAAIMTNFVRNIR